MNIHLEEVKPEVLVIGCNTLTDVSDAIINKKWWRAFALIAFAGVMIALILLVNPLLIALLTKWLMGTGWVSITSCNVAATCIVKVATTQVRKLGKYWVMKIEK